MSNPPVKFQRLRKRFLLPVIFALLGAAALSLVFFLLFFLRPHISTPSPQEATPTGIWETPEAHRGGGSARMGFVFRADGTGLFTWQATGAEAAAGQAPLLWSLDTAQRLVLRISKPDPPASGESAAATPIDIFNSHPWLWRADRGRDRLILGKLTLIEKKD